MVSEKERFRRGLPPVLMLLSALFAAAFGCDSKTAKNLKAKVKNAAAAVTKAAVKAAPKLGAPSTPSIEITTNTKSDKISSKEAFLARVKIEGRPAVTKITSYKSLEGANHPVLVMFVRQDPPAKKKAAAPASKEEEAAPAEEEESPAPGNTATAQIFYRLRESSPLWSTPIDKPVPVTIVGGDDKYMSVKLENAELRDARGQTLKLNGTVNAFTPEAAAPPKKKEASDEGEM